jgi:hypothetical protein
MKDLHNKNLRDRTLMANAKQLATTNAYGSAKRGFVQVAFSNMTFATSYLKGETSTYQLEWTSQSIEEALKLDPGQTCHSTKILQQYEPRTQYLLITAVMVKKARAARNQKKRQHAFHPVTRRTHTSYIHIACIFYSPGLELGNCTLQNMNWTTVCTQERKDTDKVNVATAVGSVCANCGATAKMKSCSMCRCRTYCGKVCQLEHWKVHKKECATLSAARRDAKKNCGRRPTAS